MKNIFSVTIITNKNCNFNCTYCYEQGKFENLDLNDKKIEDIVKFLHEFNKDKNYTFNFMLIGGEPTVSKKLKDLIKKLEEEFQNNTYQLITNGSNFNKIVNLFPDFYNMKDRIHLQISYDGKVINDIDRVIKKGNSIQGTSDIVLKTMGKLANNDIKFTLKPTLNIIHLPLVPEVLKEYRELSLKYNTVFDYGVSEVKTALHYLSKDKIKELIQESFPKILKEEKINLETFGRPITSWLRKINFKTPGAFCTAGIESITISTNLDIMYCHRCEYGVEDPDSELIYGNINEKNILNTFENNQKTLIENSNKFIDTCKNCTAIYCQKCPAELAEMNNIKSLDKIYNSWSIKEDQEDNLCFYYKEISKYLYIFWKKYLNK